MTMTDILALDLGLDLKGQEGHWLVKARIFDSRTAGYTLTWYKSEFLLLLCSRTANEKDTRRPCGLGR